MPTHFEGQCPQNQLIRIPCEEGMNTDSTHAGNFKKQLQSVDDDVKQTLAYKKLITHLNAKMRTRSKKNE